MPKGGFIESIPLPNRTPDAITPKDSVTLLKNAMYARVSGGARGFAHAPIDKFYCVKLALNDRLWLGL
ncbi:hypothetical protein [uncultured Helicobacter sp.]|uniref:hypothetical protein n=1 Tax=uncultured Helicobacter sp. TaxID=175537 RepID=UPI003750070C